jgi:HK97 family phage prohead protease
MPNPSLSVDAFRAAARASDPKDKPPADAIVRATLDTQIRAEGEDGRTLTFIISTATPDRHGDTVAVEGWQLDAFRKNPVVLWAHDAAGLPLAKADKVWIESGRLMATATFTPPGLAPFNDTVFEMLRQGFLNATSVGFSPRKYAFSEEPDRRWGIDFLEQELLEFSVVAVPANAEALVQGKAAGIDVAPMREWIEAVVKREGKVIEDRAAQDRKAAAQRIAAKRLRELDVIKARARA